MIVLDLFARPVYYWSVHLVVVSSDILYGSTTNAESIQGKTLLAKAIANESGINFISVKGPELLNMVCFFRILSNDS